MIFLNVESASRPGVGFADPAKFLFDKRSNVPGQDVFALLGTPDKVIGSFVGDVFDVLRLHTHHYNMCSSFTEEPHWDALPLLES